MDIVGYSRGAMEAVDVMNDLLTTGLRDVGSLKVTRDDGTVYIDYERAWEPTIRFAGLISPVIGPEEGTWPTAIPEQVANVYEASATKPMFHVLKVHEQTLTQDPQHPDGIPKEEFPYTHQEIGHKPDVKNALDAAARRDGVVFGS
jgi:hypothetical protein